MVIELCTCNWGVLGLTKLPPHYHYMAGLAKFQDGREEWLAGALGANGELFEQREFIKMSVAWDRAELVKFINGIGDDAWTIPESHRPVCPLNGKQCSSWTCVFDVCIDPADTPSGNYKRNVWKALSGQWMWSCSCGAHGEEAIQKVDDHTHLRTPPR